MATTHLDVIDVSPIDDQIKPVSGNSSVSPLLPIDLLYEEFTRFEVFICQELTFLKQELFVLKRNPNKRYRYYNTFQQACNDKTWYKNVLGEKIILPEKKTLFLLQKLHNKENIIEKLSDSIPSNNNKAKTKISSRNVIQKVQDQEKEKEKFLESIREIRDPPQRDDNSKSK